MFVVKDNEATNLDNVHYFKAIASKIILYHYDSNTEFHFSSEEAALAAFKEIISYRDMDYDFLNLTGLLCANH